MSSELVAQWSRRVQDAETELDSMQSDMDAIRQQRKTLKTDIRKYEDVIATEKRELLASLERVEAQARALGTQCEAALTEKDRVEAEYVTALDDYEKLHFVVRDIQDAEEHLRTRDDLEARLRQESLAWAEEEHAMRRRLHQLQQQQQQTQRVRQVEVQELEMQLATVDRRQREERAARVGEMTEAARSVVRGGKQTPKAASTMEGDAFVRANTQVPVPTRAAALRSCLRTKEREDMAAASAPASRGASQSLLNDSDAPTLSGLQQLRANSYAAPAKAGMRKREFLADFTNEQFPKAPEK